MTRNRPGRRGQPTPLDVTAILLSRISVARGPTVTRMHPVEAFLRALVGKAIKGDMRAARRLLRECLEAGLLAVPEEADDHQYLLGIPKDWDHDEWMSKYI